MPMIRTQVYLPKDLYQDLNFYAQSEKINISQAIRQGARVILDKAKKKKKKLLPFENMIGTGSLGGPKDLYKKIDYYLYEEPYKTKKKK